MEVLVRELGIANLAILGVFRFFSMGEKDFGVPQRLQGRPGSAEVTEKPGTWQEGQWEFSFWRRSWTVSPMTFILLGLNIARMSVST
jgi:hypothetical protein